MAAVIVFALNLYAYTFFYVKLIKILINDHEKHSFQYSSNIRPLEMIPTLSCLWMTRQIILNLYNTPTR